MARSKERGGDEGIEILKDILIVQLALAGVKQQSIRTVLGCDINRVNRIVKHLKNRNTSDKAKEA